jgi:cell division protein FtsI (penicillin-binding protein 3)
MSSRRQEPQGPRRRPAPRPGTSGAASRSRVPRRPAGCRPYAPAGGVRLAAARPRLRLVGLGLALVMLVFVARLFQVQAVDAPRYTAMADADRAYTATLPAARGAITDRDGVDLADSVDAYDIVADPLYFTKRYAGTADAPEQAAGLLAPIVGGDEKTIQAQLGNYPKSKSRYALIARQQSPQVWKQIKDLKNAFAGKATKGDGGNILLGITRQEHSKRVYPAGDLAAGVLGFMTGDGAGGGGLEAQLNKELAGRDGKITYAQSGGVQVPTAGFEEKPAEPGTKVGLTLDRDVQWAAQEAISQQVERSRADRGYVVVQDTRTGEVLAMANAPGYDPGDMSRADPDALGNPALQDAYEPGSTSKLISMAAVVDRGVATPGTKVTVPGTLPRADRIFHDDVDHGTWYLTLNGVLAKSSNIGTILATQHLGTTQAQANRVLYSYLHKFGIGAPTGLDFPGETNGILARPQDWNASQQYTIPFGQGLSVNALQATSVYSTIAAGGVRIQPTLIKGTTGPDGVFVPQPVPRKTRVVSPRTARTLSEMLESVVGSEQGTGVKARIPGYRVAGKTGTANRVDPKTGTYRGYTASFTGFAPADKPRLTVSCVIQNPTRGSYFGGQICGPVFKKVMEFALKSLGVPPTGAKAPGLPVAWDPAKP